MNSKVLTMADELAGVATKPTATYNLNEPQRVSGDNSRGEMLRRSVMRPNSEPAVSQLDRADAIRNINEQMQPTTMSSSPSSSAWSSSSHPHPVKEPEVMIARTIMLINFVSVLVVANMTLEEATPPYPFFKFLSGATVLPSPAWHEGTAREQH